MCSSNSRFFALHYSCNIDVISNASPCINRLTSQCSNWSHAALKVRKTWISRWFQYRLSLAYFCVRCGPRQSAGLVMQSHNSHRGWCTVLPMKEHDNCRINVTTTLTAAMACNFQAKWRFNNSRVTAPKRSRPINVARTVVKRNWQDSYGRTVSSCLTSQL